MCTRTWWLRELIELRATSFAQQLVELDLVMKHYRVLRATVSIFWMPIDRHGLPRHFLLL
jgi:hypothetical protein